MSTRQAMAASWLLFAAMCASSATYAKDCRGLNELALQNEVLVPGADAGRVVIGKGRLQFYSAPDYSCKMPGVFIIERESVDAYAEYEGFTSVVYLGRKQNGPVGGWVRSDRLRPNDLGIAPMQH